MYGVQCIIYGECTYYGVLNIEKKNVSCTLYDTCKLYTIWRTVKVQCIEYLPPYPICTEPPPYPVRTVYDTQFMAYCVYTTCM